MAENAIGPTAFRNDDILTLYSGKTVEVNNCDAVSVESRSEVNVA
jgi:probable aminopeptidase NPEPL1